jgi:hypothetical protein
MNARVDKDVMDNNPKLVGFNNGVLDLTGDVPVFHQGKPDDYVNMSMG